MNTKNKKKRVYTLSIASMMALGLFAFMATTSIKANSNTIGTPVLTALHTTSLSNVTTDNTQSNTCPNGHINCDGSCTNTGNGTSHTNQNHKGQCRNTSRHNGTGKQRHNGHN